MTLIPFGIVDKFSENDDGQAMPNIPRSVIQGDSQFNVYSSF